MSESHRTALFSDTSPEAEEFLLSLLREAPGWRKLQMVSQMNATVRTLAISGLRKRHPKAGPEELHRRLAGLLLGEDLATKAYGPLAEED
jgi:hypothetical protein